ncbi:hypothetical protein RND81_09G228900 [Saponaria officinalis]|uniref:C2H2-type domain-containing protein n=1 Tax=Saponaria officinalis TaxID=3572 RepID=A0AAW1IRC3_SAPOF
MPGIIYCGACNKEFSNVAEQQLHYKSDWHFYNLKRKVARVQRVSEAVFQASQAEEKKKLNETAMLYSCGVCGKGYRSSKAHAQHLNSKSHLTRASQGENSQTDNTIIRPLLQRRTPAKDFDIEEEDGYEEELDPTRCFMCDLKNPTLETCMLHLHKKHGFFIPDIEYLSDPKGLLTYLGLKVRRDYLCLYCDERCRPFSSLEAARKHMVAKGHCKVRYGDGDHEEEVELEEFYDYSSSYMDNDGKVLVAKTDDGEDCVELGCGGCELILKRRTESGVCATTLGSREFLRYYKQNPRPTPANALAISIAKAGSCSEIIGLTTEQRKERAIRLKVMKQIRRFGKDAMMLKRTTKKMNPANYY